MTTAEHMDRLVELLRQQSELAALRDVLTDADVNALQDRLASDRRQTLADVTRALVADVVADLSRVLEGGDEPVQPTTH